MALETVRFDVQDYLKTSEGRAAYLDAAFEDGTISTITLALRDVARAVGMSEVARRSGISREGLYKALSEDGDPRLSTLLGVARSLGVNLSVRPGSADEEAA